MVIRGREETRTGEGEREGSEGKGEKDRRRL